MDAGAARTRKGIATMLGMVGRQRFVGAGLLLLGLWVGGPGCGGAPEEGERAGAERYGSVGAGVSGATPTCVTLQRGLSGAVADASITTSGFADGNTTTNHGSSNSLSLGAASSQQVEGLLRFDLGAVPPGAVITSANVNLHVLLNPGTPVRAHRVTAPWSESQVTWASFAGAFAPAVEAILPGTSAPTASLAGLVQAWVDGSVENDGILLERDLTGFTVFASSEYTQSLRPSLDVCYTLGACPVGQSACNNACVDLLADAANCGACGHACAAGGSCVAGACVAPACPGVLAGPPAGTSPVSVAAGDLDGDGHADVVVAGAGSNTVSVLLGHGDGTFAAAVSYPAGSSPIAVATADLNGDGALDLAVADQGGGVSVLLNQGDGTFSAAISHAAGPNPYALAVADFDGDGRPDLVIANVYVDTVSVLLNQGNGAFGSPAAYPVGYTPVGLAAADVNGDGRPDLVVANVNSNNVSVLLNQGNGTLGLAVSYPAASNPQAVTVADLDGDGVPDVAVANLNGSTVSVLLGHGNGTFAASVQYASINGLQAIAAVDLDGDGRLDLAVSSNGSGVGVLRNQGNGTFGPMKNHPLSSGAQSLVVADLNGNGKPDLAISGNSASGVGVLLDGCLP
jgi:hypothetical protein